MKLLTDDIRNRLIHNNVTAREADHIPVVKLFVPWGNATWILTEMEPDGICFGLCDLGLGEPELGYVSVSELEAVKGPHGLRVERDLHFTTDKPLSQWTETARRYRRIRDPNDA